MQNGPEFREWQKCDIILDPRYNQIEHDIKGNGKLLRKVYLAEDVNSDGVIDYYVRGENRNDPFDSKDFGWVNGNDVYTKMTED